MIKKIQKVEQEIEILENEGIGRDTDELDDEDKEDENNMDWEGQESNSKIQELERQKEELEKKVKSNPFLIKKIQKIEQDIAVLKDEKKEWDIDEWDDEDRREYTLGGWYYSNYFSNSKNTWNKDRSERKSMVNYTDIHYIWVQFESKYYPWTFYWHIYTYKTRKDFKKWKILMINTPKWLNKAKVVQAHIDEKDVTFPLEYIKEID